MNFLIFGLKFKNFLRASLFCSKLTGCIAAIYCSFESPHYEEPAENWDFLFLHTLTGKKKVYWKPPIFLSCPKLAFFDVMGESSYLVWTVKTGPFWNILAGTCLFSRSAKCKILLTLVWKMNNSVLKGKVSRFDFLNMRQCEKCIRWPQKTLHVKISIS